MNSELQGREDALAWSRHIGPRHRRAVALLDQLERATLRVTEQALSIHGDQIRLREKPEISRFDGRGGHLCHGNGFEILLYRFHQLDRFAPTCRTNTRGSIYRTQQHLLTSTAARQQPNPNLYQTHVQLSVRLTRGGMQSDLSSSSKTHPEWRDNNRLRTELDGLCHALEAADCNIDFVPVTFLNGHEQQHDVGADGEMLCVIGDNESVELVQSRAARFQRLRNELHDVATERVHLRMKLDGSDAVT